MFRILPVAIMIMAILAGTKFLEAIKLLPDVFNTQKSIASEEEVPKEEAKKEDAPKEGGHNSGENISKEAGEHNAEYSKGDSKDVKYTTEKPADVFVGSKFSDEEILLLKELAKRRDELDLREKDITLKENTLTIIEKSIENKMQNMKKLQNEMKAIIAEYESKEDDKMHSLVKVYESMKPQDAAKIFDQLDMNILIEVSVKMKEAKLAQVLAKMDPKRAKEVTIELANRRKISQTK